MSATTKFRVQMTCGGCEKAVTAMLKKVNGVEDVQASHTDKTVTVTGTASDADMIAAIKKTGKDAVKIE